MVGFFQLSKKKLLRNFGQCKDTKGQPKNRCDIFGNFLLLSLFTRKMSSIELEFQCQSCKYANKDYNVVGLATLLTKISRGGESISVQRKIVMKFWFQVSQKNYRVLWVISCFFNCRILFLLRQVISHQKYIMNFEGVFQLIFQFPTFLPSKYLNIRFVLFGMILD